MEHPGVKFPPPFIYLLGFLIAWLLETRVTRIHLIGGDASTASLQIAGVILASAGLLLVFWGLLTFARVRTGILPMRPATRIVDHGPYSFTRNPMYTGLAITFLGAALFLNYGWMLVMLPLVMIAIYNFVIKREERYLTSAFPEEYGLYRRKVRRWL
jgi:protein-S-isoprenylcysteine O-methyltransferase Ste14